MNITVFYDHMIEACKQTGKSFEEVGKILRSYDVSGVELDYSSVGSRLKEKRIKKQLEQVDMFVGSIYGIFDFGNKPKETQGYALVDSARRMGAKNILVIPGSISEEQDKDSLIINMKYTLIRICEYAAKKGIIVGMEDFDDKNAPYSTAAGLSYFLTHVPELKCIFDTGNFLYSEEDALEVLPQFINNIGYVHCKDRTFTEKKGEQPKLTIKGRKMYSAPVGMGCIPMDEIINRIRESGFNGNFAIELFGSVNQLEDIKISAEYLKH